MIVNMPQEVKYILDVLINNGFEAYIVGGCVRDSILGKIPKDWDITTNASPYDVKRLFKRTIDTGIQHGTVTVMIDKIGYEVTTYRIDGKYNDHRRPEEVTFTKSLTEDLKRRDFTINAMAYNDVDGLIDKFNGIGDLQDGIIRCVGEATERFDEDALRILRAVRFAAQLDFRIDPMTMEAIKEKCSFLEAISAERIQVELTKLLTSNNPEKLVLAYELGITGVVLPEFDLMMKTDQNNVHHIYSVGMHSIYVMKNIEPSPILRWAALLHDSGKPLCKTTDMSNEDHFYNHGETGVVVARRVLLRLKLDNYTIERVVRLIRWHDYAIGQVPGIKTFRKSLSKMGTDLFDDFIKLRIADISGKNNIIPDSDLEGVNELKAMYKTIMEEGDALSVKDLAIDGKDLIAMGVRPGPEMGNILNLLLNIVLEEPQLNKKEILIDKVKTRYNL